jgi:hypothetical protein
MAIIYSYSKTNEVYGSDLLVLSRFHTGAHEDNGRNYSLDIATLAAYIGNNYASSLNAVLQTGNTSLLNAKIGELYLYDTSETEYGYIRISDSGLDVVNANDTLVSRIDTGGITIVGPSYGSVILTGTITANRNYTLPNKSGTFAMTSDIISPSTYGLATQLANSTPVSGTTTPGVLNGSSISGSLSVPANGFAVGNTFELNMMGHITCINGTTLTITIETVSGVILATTGSMSMNITTDKHWVLNTIFVIRAIGTAVTAKIMTAGSFSANKNSNNNSETFNFVSENTTTFNTTVANELVVKATWGSTSGTNSIYSNVLTLNKIF